MTGMSIRKPRLELRILLLQGFAVISPLNSACIVWQRSYVITFRAEDVTGGRNLLVPLADTVPASAQLHPVLCVFHEEIVLKTHNVQSSPVAKGEAPGDERRYRLHFFRQDAHLFTAALVLGLLFNLLLIRADHLMTRGTPTFQWLLLLRLGLIGLCVWTGLVIWRSGDPDRMDRWGFLWSMACVAANTLVILTRPATYTGHVVIDLFIIIGLYTLVPGPMHRRMGPPLLLSLSSVVLFFTVKSAMGYLASLSTVASYIGANTIGMLLSVAWHRYRRESFFANEALEELYRQAEAGRLAAETSERTWERIIDTSPDMLFVINRQYRIVRVNRTFCERLGIDRGRALGRPCHELLRHLASPCERCPTHRLRDTLQPHRFETRFPPLDIESRIMSAPLFDAQGDHEATVFIVQDISAQKRSERELHAAEEQYRSLVQNSHGIIFTIRPDGVLTYLSPSYTKLVGYKPATAIGKHFRDVVHPLDVQSCEAFQRETVQSGECKRGIEYRVVHRDGSIRWHLSNFIACRDAEGTVRSFVGNAIDITELKHYQFELNAAREAAEKAHRTKSEFLAMVSHEIRTPLNAMVGFSALARQTTDGAALRQYIDILDRSSRMLMDLVNNILDMSKAEAGRLRLDPIAFNLPEAIDLLQWQYTPVAAQKKLALQIDKDANLPLWVNGDPLRFRQIVSNLLSNALKFTEKGTVICTFSAKGDLPREGDCVVRLEVKDTGIGIEEGNLELLFQPFRQLDPGTARKYGGSGLGLAIVRRLVDLMQGQIRLSSRFGEGTCVTVELPFSLAAPPLYREIATERTEPLHILVVEDNVFNRILVRDTLRSWGHAVTEAERAMEALEMLDRTRFDGIVLDVRMPDMDGVELTRRLRLLERLSNVTATPVIAYTADTDGATEEQCLRAGMQAVLFKPLDRRLLAAALAEHCRQDNAAHTPPASPPATAMALAGHVCAEMGDNPQRLHTYAQLLREDIENELTRLDQAIVLEDRRLFQEAAHSLKGLCGYLRDRRPGALAVQIHAGAADAAYASLHDLAKQLRAACTWAWAEEST